MGNSKSTRKTFDQLDTSDNDIGITIKIIDLNNSYTENLICELVQKSKADTFTYFKVSTKLAKIINTDVVYNIDLYKLGTDLSTVTSIDKAYRYQSDLGTMKENLINKTRFYDFVPNGRNDIILRHDGFKNLIKIIIRGRPFM
jgi:hypothetical protein|tara:strand:+ start:13851 stop:14279 length:429 start_codon:yes stop_codon:yes gene_type:complete